MALVKQVTSDPTLEQLLELERTWVVDIAPPAPSSGVGTGNVLVTGEFEDGPFAAGGDSDKYNPDQRGPLEIFGSVDLEQKFGSFGYNRAGVLYNDPSARFSGGELWNGSGFIKLSAMRMSRLFISRVDTSVGSVQLTPQATMRGTIRGPYVLAVGAWLSLDPNAAGAAAADAIAATAATFTADAVPGVILAGDAITITVDGNAPVTVVFAGGEVIATIVSTINTALGATIASDSGGMLALTGQVLGTLGSVSAVEVVAGSGVRLGYTAPVLPLSASGTGNVGNTLAITAAELVAIVNGTAALSAVTARVDENGFPVFSAVTSIEATTGTGIAALGLPSGVIAVADHLGGTVQAGLRVTDATTTYVVMQTLTYAAADVTATTVKVRPANDNGTALGAGAGTVTTMTDQPSFADFAVNNALAISAALLDPAKDTLYETALNATLGVDPSKNPSRDADFSVSARRTDTVVRAGRQNAIDATEQGLRNRKFITRAPLGFSQAQAITDVALFRSDRVFYGYPGIKMRIPEIALRGTAGGQGFTANGIITVGFDNPITTLCARLNPEQNPGESGTQLIEYVTDIEDIGVQLTEQSYIAFKAAGIMAPFRDPDTSWEIYSGITSSLTSGRTTAARRKMADFLQDSYKSLVKPFQKKLNRQRERDAAADAIQSFHDSLLPENQPDLQRIVAAKVDRDSGNTPDRLALGIYVILTVVRTLSSLDAIVIRTEIGENAIVTSEI